ncbi:hypothetical protein FNV43_RR24875 [Rhamnella rubrinervis]|uniref:DUF674 domain-containing protein n=1 Tax=Rhamnella rubrinervis TaxID=2594499 RepID=A0A8K0DMC1_9ROSA|nr:hypothetical protein FNV43_RR24875 [Rhamnella rubrinervis]
MAATTNPKDDGLQLKLLVDTQRQRVLFAEANKDFVDFLFTLLCLPTGTVTKLLTSKSMVGSLGNVYQSIENLHHTYLQLNLEKNTLLNPKAPIGSYPKTPLLLPNAPSKLGKKFYICDNGGSRHNYVADEPGAICPSCNWKMSTVMSYVAVNKGAAQGSSSSEGGGYVKVVVTYMVMDDLQVQPLSLISTLALLTKHTRAGALEEKLVSVGVDEGLKLLKASLETKTVLTDVFLKKTEVKLQEDKTSM